MAASQNHGRLHCRTCIITGSSSGLGRAIALAFASEGAHICLVDIYTLACNPLSPTTGKSDAIENRSSKLPGTLDVLIAKYGNERLDGKSGPRFAFVKADMTMATEAERAISKCIELFGRLDVMANNAGISVESTHVKVLKCHETSEEDFEKTMSVNCKAVFLGCKYALRQMVEHQEAVDWDGKGEARKMEWDRGWIVNTASIQGFVAFSGTPSYAASKGAVVMLTKQIALDYAPFRIHANALCPGFLRTAMTQNLQALPDVLKQIESAHPFGGMGDPEDVARAAVFLVSRDAAWITGVPLLIDGGYCVQ